MIVQFQNLTSKHYVVVFDLEHDNGKLMQLSCLLFEKQQENPSLYTLKRSLNSYVKQSEVSPFIERYTKITKEFLDANGAPLQEVRENFENVFLKGIELKDVLFASHDVIQDKRVLGMNDFNVEKMSFFCTYKYARKVLKREHSLRLVDISNDCAYALVNSHNAYMDAWATVAVLSYLLNEEKESKMKVLDIRENLKIVEVDINSLKRCVIEVNLAVLDMPLKELDEWLGKKLQLHENLLLQFMLPEELIDYYELLAVSSIHLIANGKKKKIDTDETYKDEIKNNIFLPLSTMIKLAAHKSKVKLLNIQVFVEGAGLHWEMVNNERKE